MKYNKTLTSNLAICDAPIPDELIFPISQHIGKPSEPVVIKGDLVKKGQLIAKANGVFSSNIHSSVSGEVTAIKPHPHTNGRMVNSIFIKNDHAETSITATPIDLKNIDIKELVQLISDAGVVGLGGATFPTHIKLSPGKSIDTLILNGAECEPYLTTDHRLMIEESDDLFLGITALQKILKPTKTFIGVEDNKIDAINALKRRALNHSDLTVKSLKTMYPQGAEKVLVYNLVGRRVRKLPLDVGVVVVNVATAAQIGRTVKTGMPLIDRIVTVSGPLVEKRANYKVRMGTPFKALLTEMTEEKLSSLPPYKILSGGPMMGASQYTLDVPVIKGTSGILVLPNDVPKEESCIRCATCVDACPIDLMPLQVAFKGFQAMDCMECGLCAYVCPCKINLVQRIRSQKQTLMENRK
jgi:Na+-translocating ferredoxin:NAD+ oxidoreductase subunit C